VIDVAALVVAVATAETEVTAPGTTSDAVTMETSRKNRDNIRDMDSGYLFVVSSFGECTQVSICKFKTKGLSRVLFHNY
jgi:hypothetical protein